MGLIADLSNVQETYRGLFRDLYAEGGASDVDEDAVVAVCCVFQEMRQSRDGYIPEADGPQEADVLAAIEFIDHLDTLGKVVMSK